MLSSAATFGFFLAIGSVRSLPLLKLTHPEDDVEFFLSFFPMERSIGLSRSFVMRVNYRLIWKQHDYNLHLPSYGQERKDFQR